MSLKILISKTAQKELSQINRKDAITIKERILTLAEDIKIEDVKKLTNREAYRMRIGNYRLIFETDFNSFINILHIGHRKHIYKWI